MAPQDLCIFYFLHLLSSQNVGLRFWATQWRLKALSNGIYTSNLQAFYLEEEKNIRSWPGLTARPGSSPVGHEQFLQTSISDKPFWGCNALRQKQTIPQSCQKQYENIIQVAKYQTTQLFKVTFNIFVIYSVSNITKNLYIPTFYMFKLMNVFKSTKRVLYLYFCIKIKLLRYMHPMLIPALFTIAKM